MAVVEKQMLRAALFTRSRICRAYLPGILLSRPDLVRVVTPTGKTVSEVLSIDQHSVLEESTKFRFGEIHRVVWFRGGI
jgi:hypothetical protein